MNSCNTGAGSSLAKSASAMNISALLNGFYEAKLHQFIQSCSGPSFQSELLQCMGLDSSTDMNRLLLKSLDSVCAEIVPNVAAFSCGVASDSVLGPGAICPLCSARFTDARAHFLGVHRITLVEASGRPELTDLRLELLCAACEKYTLDPGDFSKSMHRVMNILNSNVASRASEGSDSSSLMDDASVIPQSSFGHSNAPSMTRRQEYVGASDDSCSKKSQIRLADVNNVELAQPLPLHHSGISGAATAVEVEDPQIISPTRRSLRPRTNHTAPRSCVVALSKCKIGMLSSPSRRRASKSPRKEGFSPIKRSTIPQPEDKFYAVAHKRFFELAHSKTAARRCAVCRHSSRSVKGFMWHIFDHACTKRLLTFNCPHCLTVYKRYRFLATHLLSVHAELPIVQREEFTNRSINELTVLLDECYPVDSQSKLVKPLVPATSSHSILHPLFKKRSNKYLNVMGTAMPSGSCKTASGARMAGSRVPRHGFNSMVKNHLKHFSTSKVLCKVCDKEYTKERIAVHVMDVHSFVNAYECTRCKDDERFDTCKEFRAHSTHHHPLVRPSYRLCIDPPALEKLQHALKRCFPVPVGMTIASHLSVGEGSSRDEQRRTMAQQDVGFSSSFAASDKRISNLYISDSSLAATKLELMLCKQCGEYMSHAEVDSHVWTHLQLPEPLRCGVYACTYRCSTPAQGQRHFDMVHPMSTFLLETSPGTADLMPVFGQMRITCFPDDYQ